MTASTNIELRADLAIHHKFEAVYDLLEGEGISYELFQSLVMTNYTPAEFLAQSVSFIAEDIHHLAVEMTVVA